MNWRLPGLLAALCLVSACQEEPVGQMKPIPRPPGMASAPPPPQAQALAPAPAPQPPADPSQVLLRWNLAEDAPTAFRLTTRASTSQPAPEPKRKKGRKPPPPPPSRMQETSSVYVLQKSESGDYSFRIVPPGGRAEQGTMSERGFVLDGLAGHLRNTAVLVLELPREPVGVGDTWSLATQWVDLGAQVPGFVEQKAERSNQVKLLALTPAADGEQVATLEYRLSERVSGVVRDAAARLAAREAPQAKSRKAAPEQPVSVEARVTGRGEFLVKAGRWRSWEGTVTLRHQGPRPEGDGAADGERQLRLTPLAAVPPELLAPRAKR